MFDVESGNTVADALSKHPRAFTNLYVNMVAAGEAGGILDTILASGDVPGKNDALVKGEGRHDDPSERHHERRGGRHRRAPHLRHPGVREHVPDRSDSRCRSTRIVGSAFAVPQIVLVGTSAVIIVGAYMFKKYYASNSGKLVIDRLMLKMPVLGDVLRKSAVSRFTRTLGTLISSGVSILEGLEITAKTAGNRVIQDAIMQSRSSIAGGDTIAQPLQKSKVFPPMVISMIAVGEQTGGLDEMLSKIADFYDEEVDAAVSNLLSLLEPIMIVFLGVVVGGMVVAMYLPIFDMINAVQ